MAQPNGRLRGICIMLCLGLKRVPERSVQANVRPLRQLST